MIAAIYARKSTDQNVAEEAKSVTRQVERGKAFAAAKGWTVDDRHVFIDDGISGAEFKKRPGLQRMLACCDRFQALIVSEQKSIGRESFETNYLIKQLAQAGVEILEYVHGKSLTPKNWLDKAMSAVQSAADEAHREQTRERVHEAHLAKALRGYVTGGRVFGYRNKDIYNGVDQHGRPLRSHVEREIDEAEGAVVRRIFSLFGDEHLGLRRIAKLLNQERAIKPKPFRRKDGTAPNMDWSSSTVRSVLQRELYHGVVVWNRSRKRNDWGQVDQRDRPASEWLRVEMPTLRIISDDLWTRVQARLQQTEGHAMRFAGGRLAGRPPKHGIVNLLAGLATCGVCGGSLVVETSARKGKRVAEYVCHSRRHKGTCGNTLRASADVMHESVLHWLEEQVFTPEALEHVIQFTETTHQQSTDRRQALEREQRDLKRRIENLHRAIEDGGDSTSLVQRLRQQESRLAAVEAEQASLRPVPRLAEAVVRDRLEEWRRLVRGSVTQGRTVIQRVVDGRLTFVPREDGYGYDFTAKTRFDRVFAGCVIQVPANERRDDDLNVVFDASDTLDADYGRLLNALYGMSFLSDR